MPNWTKAQQQAIDTRGCNLLVAAAAGSGKTAVLVARIIKYIRDEEQSVDIDRLLIVTFTNAAAAEMKAKIGAAINEALLEKPHCRHLHRQNLLLNKASITTLHSFCLEIVRENFYRLGLDANFRITDDTEGKLLRLDVLEDLLERHYTNAQEQDDFTRLIDAYGGQRDDSLIQGLINQLYRFSRSTPWPQAWLDKMVANFDDWAWSDQLLPVIQEDLHAGRQLLKQAYDLAQSPGGPVAYSENLASELAFIDDLIAAARGSWQQLYAVFAGLDFQKLPRVKKDAVDEEIQQRVKNQRDQAKKKLKDLRDKYFQRSPQALAVDLTKLKPHLKMLCQLVSEFGLAYQQQKAARNLVDFNDLEHFCLQLLLDQQAQPGEIKPSTLSEHLKKHFIEVLVDEYQDINDLQETILQLVSKGNNLFMVGDIKQSIYRFRLAQPEIFLKKYQAASEQTGKTIGIINLASNFRCRSAIVEAVNFVFRQIMTVKTGGSNYDRQTELIYGADYPKKELYAAVELHIIEKPAKNNNSESDSAEPPDDLNALEREARVIGQRIQALVQGGYQVFDKKKQQYRPQPLTYRDIVILMRSPGSMAAVFTEQFKLLEIPVYSERASGYFEATEVQTMLALLKIIDNPRQDIPLAAVLRSMVVGLTAAELATIRLNSVEGDFYDAVVKTAGLIGQGTPPFPSGGYPKIVECPHQLKLQKFLKQLTGWQVFARQGNLANLIWALYRETGYFDYVGAMPGGRQRQANLRVLHDRARRYQQTSLRGLFLFLRFLEKLQINKNDLEPAKIFSENENVVRIISIHKSKGLEFPVVFIAGLGRQFNLADLKQEVLLHKDLGLGPEYINSEKRIKYPTIAKIAIAEQVRAETLAEEMRILYVAMTRAEEKLILVGAVRDLAKSATGWCQDISASTIMQAKSLLDWLGLTLVRHNDGAVLRRLAGCEEPGAKNEERGNDNSRWDLTIHQEDQVYVNEESKVEQQSVSNAILLKQVKNLQPVQPEGLNDSLQARINQALNWQYPFANTIGKAAKVTLDDLKLKEHPSLAELKRVPGARGEDKGARKNINLDASNRPVILKRPQFLQQKTGLSATERGTAFHLVMQHIDLKQAVTGRYLAELLADLEKREILTAEQRAVINPNQILKFFNGPLGQRLLKATGLQRELAFSLALPAGTVYPDLLFTDEKVLVQGVLDCLWYEGDGWIIVDYKSDYVLAEDINDFVERYRGQLNLYSLAVEKILKQPVKERYLYLFGLGRAVLI
ncbi:MAG: helicase-exonuclease AddAB subunit AddA [Desulfotomaculum sp.]|nr:helicase-exonuclease AddAB subunit AddA [Desulfotomaculum sp.]